MNLKHCTAEIKAVGDDDESGVFTAYASVFGNVDSYGDVVIKGAFTESLSEWLGSGAPIPAFYVHQMSGSAFMNVGWVLEASEDDHGLLVKVQLDIEDNPEAKYIYKLLKQKRLRQMSFAYDVIESSRGERDEKTVYELRKLKLHEVSVVPLGANQATEVLDVKTTPGTPAKDSDAGVSAPAEQKSPAEAFTPTPVRLAAEIAIADL